MEFEFGLYPVITEEFCLNMDSVETLKEVIKGGAKIVQLREKKRSKDKFFLLAQKYRELTKSANVKLIINDHVDVALAVQADGVHLGQNDLPCKACRKIAPTLIIGVSTHNVSEIKKAKADGASYINVGPIFPTNTKKVTNDLGLDYLKQLQIDIPFSVMGGIKEKHIIQLVKLDVKNIAMVTEITMSSNVSQKVSKLISLI